MTRPILWTFLIFTALIAFYAPARPAHAEACAHAPASLVVLGDSAVIARGVDRLNMRFLPAVGTGIVATLYQNTAVTLIGGPSCNGLYTWWRVQVPGGASGWIAEATWQRYFVLPTTLPPEVPADTLPTPFEWSCVLRYNARHCQ